MTEINIMNKKFENIGTIKSPVALTSEVVNVPVVHQVVKALLANRRQGTACTKNKSLVRGGGKKPFKQKGTGRARQGSTRSPLQVGGGTVFGPTPRSFEQKVNKRVMLKAIQSVLADKLQSGKLLVVDEIASSGKTKEMAQMLDDRGLKSVLVLTKDADSLALRAVRNLQYGYGLPVDAFSVYEAIKYENLLVEKEALEKLLARIDN